MLCCRAPPRGVTLHILRALKSDRWDPATLDSVHSAAAATALPAATRGATKFHELPDASHWLLENQSGLVQMMLPSLLQAAAA